MLIYRIAQARNGIEFQGIHDRYWVVFRINGERWVYSLSFKEDAQKVAWIARRVSPGKALSYTQERKRAEMKVTDKWPGENPGKEILIWREGDEMTKHRGEKPEEQKEREELKDREDEVSSLKQQELF